MKKIFSVLLFLLCGFIFADENAKDPGGYQEFKWLMNLDEVKEIMKSKYEESALTNQFLDKWDEERIGLFSTKNILYIWQQMASVIPKTDTLTYRKVFGFFKEKLFKVSILIDPNDKKSTPEEIENLLKEQLIKKYGEFSNWVNNKPEKLPAYEEEFNEYGTIDFEKTLIEFKIFKKINWKGEITIFSIYITYLNKEIEKEYQKELEEYKKDQQKIDL